ncbi:hypothetical protein FF38_09045 [Lucilia cuprina]|uniref:Uncharacterized protein n=1 Tax=Lucilia cuprina TaxID=7375 RepID=A0A0L0BN29_LUCCU|nr:hypothetical protein FF38_09045 [Lucilia cuprina]
MLENEKCVTSDTVTSVDSFLTATSVDSFVSSTSVIGFGTPTSVVGLDTATSVDSFGTSTSVISHQFSLSFQLFIEVDLHVFLAPSVLILLLSTSIYPRKISFAFFIEGADVDVDVRSAVPAVGGSMDINQALQEVLKKSLTADWSVGGPMDINRALQKILKKS